MKPEERRLRNILAQLVDKTVTFASETLDTDQIPMRVSQSIWMERRKDGGYGGEPRLIKRPDLETFWLACRQLEESAEWKKAEAAIEAYEKSIGSGKDDSLWLSYGGYCQQMINEYLRQTPRLEVSPELVDDVVNKLVGYCGSNTDTFKMLVALEDFSAPEPFALDGLIRFRPIAQEELEDVGQTEEPLLRFTPRPWPRSDWWICEIKATGNKGSPEAWNNLHPLQESVEALLPVFKKGKISATVLRISKDGPFGPGMAGRGRQKALSVRGEPYSLTQEEAHAMQRFWPTFQKLVKENSHYLQVARKRLEFGCQRTRLEDALVDFVIGLESLLSKKDEQTEIRYRMSVRGAVVLAIPANERLVKFKQMQDLYDSRSAIVHGGQKKQERLKDDADFGENALRTCWRWYFDNYARDTTNKRAIGKLDSLLLSPES